MAVAPHCPNGPVSLAASLRVASARLNVPIHEQSLGMHYHSGYDGLPSGEMFDYLTDPAPLHPGWKDRGMVNPAVPPAAISVALLTPFTDTGALDVTALDRLVVRALDSGVAGISPVGSTGEGPRLSREQRRGVVARVAATAQGAPVIAGVPAGPVDEVLAELAGLADAGAHAALVAPPGYYPISDSEVLALFTALADRTPLPLVLYHIPSLARVGFSPAVVGELAPHPSVVGIKDSSRDLEHLRTVVRAAADADFAVLTGTDALLTESLAAGAVGAIVASPNVAPGLAAAVRTAYQKGDLAGARRLQDQLLELVTGCRRGRGPAGWKAAAALTGVCGDRMAPPAEPLPAAEQAELRAALLALGLIEGTTE